MAPPGVSIKTNVGEGACPSLGCRKTLILSLRDLRKQIVAISKLQFSTCFDEKIKLLA